MELTEIPNEGIEHRGKAREIYKMIVEANHEGKAVSFGTDEINNSLLAQLYRMSKSDSNRLHSTTKKGRYVLWMD